MRQLYWAALSRLDTSVGKKSLEEFTNLQDQHIDLSSTISGVQISFVWDPWLNATAHLGHLAHFRYRPDTPQNEALAKEENRQSPAIIVMGSPGLWAARNGGDEFLQIFGEGINTVLPWLRADIDDMTQLPESYASTSATAPSRTSEGGLSNSVFLVPVLSPRFESLSYGRRATMTAKRIDMMNWSLRNSDAVDQSYILWGFEAMARERQDAHLDDGIHAAEFITDQRLTIILNARCNAGLQAHDIESHVTCCTPYPKHSAIQRIFLIMAVMGLPWLVMDPGSPSNRMLRGVIAASYMLYIASLCYLADRTHLFSKQQKDFNQEGYTLSMAAVGILLMLSVSSEPVRLAEKPNIKPGIFLNRTQSDEWRGWMQAFMLLYSFHGAEQSSAWYKIFRLLTSIFIFLSCYGHTRFFLRTGDFSLYRVVHVLVRLNLLSVVLVYMMDRPWTLYYFCPLLSFWFLVTYLTLSTLAGVNQSTAAVLLKVVVAAMATTLMINARGVLGGVLFALEKGLGISWDLETIRFHMAVDQLVPYFGMTAAVVSHVVYLGEKSGVDTPDLFAETGHGGLDRRIRDIFRPSEDSVPIEAMVLVFSGAALTIFLLLAFMSPRSTESYDSYHPFVGPWFVLAAIILRNCRATLRSTCFTGAVALGRISLETSLLHHHVWLSGDSTTILRLASAPFLSLPWAGPLLENSQTTILLVVLLWASVKCRKATQQITDILIPRDENRDKEKARDA